MCMCLYLSLTLPKDPSRFTIEPYSLDYLDECKDYKDVRDLLGDTTTIPPPFVTIVE